MDAAQGACVPLGSQALEVKFLGLPKVQAMNVAEVNPNSEPERTVVNALVYGLKGKL